MRALQSYGEACEADGKFTQAVKAYKEMVRELVVAPASLPGKEHQTAVAWLSLGFAYKRLREWDQAEKAYRSGVQVCSKFSDRKIKNDLLANLAKMFHQSEQPEKAIEVLREELFKPYWADEQVTGRVNVGFGPVTPLAEEMQNREF